MGDPRTVGEVVALIGGLRGGRAEPWRDRVAITGLGLVSPYGAGLAISSPACWRASPRSSTCGRRASPALDPVRPLRRIRSGCGARQTARGDDGPLRATRHDRRLRRLGRCGLPRMPDGESREDWGVCWGTALGGTLAYEKGYRELWQQGRERLSPLTVVLGMNNAANPISRSSSAWAGQHELHRRLRLLGDRYRRSISPHAQRRGDGDGHRRFRRPASLRGRPRLGGPARDGPCDRASAASACRPFSADRRGLVLGEGAAALVLEDWQHALAARRAHPWRDRRLRDQLRPQPPRPSQGAGQIKALRTTLTTPAWPPRRSTTSMSMAPPPPRATRSKPRHSDGLRQRAAQLPVSATKSMHGHLLGAAGAIEAIVTVLALRERAIPPTANLDRLDPACTGLDHVTVARHGPDASGPVQLVRVRRQQCRACLSPCHALATRNSPAIDLARPAPPTP